MIPDNIARCVGCAILCLLVGCGTMPGKKPRAGSTGASRPEVSKPSAGPKYRVPGPEHWGPEMNMKHWLVQCANRNLAMTCRKSDRTDRRCAVIRDGKYRWTYGSYCKAARLPCYRKACNSR